jgi:hypothetical protein
MRAAKLSTAVIYCAPKLRGKRELRYHAGNGGHLGELMEPHSIVVISLHTPKERLWGELMDISSSGVTLRGIDLSSFDDFVSQVLHPEGDRMGLPTLFFPMLRIERIALDEARGSIPSLAEMFEKKTGRSLEDYLAQFA